MTAYISNISFAAGPQVESISSSARAGRLVSAPELLGASGFARHHICGDKCSAYDLALQAVNPIKDYLNNVGAIVYATTLPCNGNAGDEEAFKSSGDVKHLMDFPGSRLQADFGLNGAQVYGLTQQACTGMFGSVRLASLLLSAEPETESVLCLTADRFPPGAIYEQAYNLISDGAVACTLSLKSGDFRIVSYHGITNGALSFASDDETVGNFFTYSLLVINKALSKAGLSIDDITWIVPQNTNDKAWEILARLLKVDVARLYAPSRSSLGHMISGDNMVNLKLLNESGAAKPGDKILMLMAGYGLNWQCLILEKVASSNGAGHHG